MYADQPPPLDMSRQHKGIFPNNSFRLFYLSIHSSPEEVKHNKQQILERCQTNILLAEYSFFVP